MVGNAGFFWSYGNRLQKEGPVSSSLLHHRFGIRGYQHEETEYERGEH